MRSKLTALIRGGPGTSFLLRWGLLHTQMFLKIPAVGMIIATAREIANTFPSQCVPCRHVLTQHRLKRNVNLPMHCTQARLSKILTGKGVNGTELVNTRFPLANTEKFSLLNTSSIIWCCHTGIKSGRTHKRACKSQNQLWKCGQIQFRAATNKSIIKAVIVADHQMSNRSPWQFPKSQSDIFGHFLSRRQGHSLDHSRQREEISVFVFGNTIVNFWTASFSDI